MNTTTAISTSATTVATTGAMFENVLNCTNCSSLYFLPQVDHQMFNLSVDSIVSSLSGPTPAMTDSTLVQSTWVNSTGALVHQHVSVISGNVHSWLATVLVEWKQDESRQAVDLNMVSLCLLPVSLLLNLYLCVAIMAGRTHRSRTNSLMPNIFVANLMLLVLTLPFEIHLQVQSSLSYFSSVGLVMCKVLPSLQLITEFVTSASVAILAVDKCQSIVAKHNSRITNVFSVSLLTRLIWLCAWVLCAPVLWYSDLWLLQSEPRLRPLRAVCRIDLSSLVASSAVHRGTPPAPPLTSVVHPTALVLYQCIYALPVLVSVIALCKTYVHLCQHRQRYRHVHDLQKRIRTSDREAIKMLSVVLVLQCVACHLPLHVVQAVAQFSGALHHPTDQASLDLWSMLFVVGRQLTLLGTIFSPIAYLALSGPLREQFHDHMSTMCHFVAHPSLSKLRSFRTYGPSTNSTSSTVSSSSTSSSTCPTKCRDQSANNTTECCECAGANCKHNSLHKLLPSNTEHHPSLV